MVDIERLTNDDDIIRAAIRYESYLNNNGINEVDPMIICSRGDAFKKFEDFYSKVDNDDYILFYWGTDKEIEVIEDMVVIGGVNHVHFRDIKAIEVTRNGDKITSFKILLHNGMIIRL